MVNRPHPYKDDDGRNDINHTERKVLYPCRKFVNHYLPVVYFFAVNNKSAIADSVKKAG